MLEPQDERFVRDFLQFSYFVASKSMFFYEFSHEPQNLLPQNRCFVRGFRQFSSHLTKCQACHGICTLSLLHAALTLQFAERRATSRNTTSTQNDDGDLQSAAPATKHATHRLKTTQSVLHLSHKMTFDAL